MKKHYEKIGRYLELLKEASERVNLPVERIKWQPCGYKGSDAPPAVGWKKFCGVWGGERDSHAWFRFSVNVNGAFSGLEARLSVSTDKYGWDACNPQFLLYVDGRIWQGMDTNHTTAVLQSGKHDIVLYGYTGYDINDTLKLKVELKGINRDTEKLYYDMRVPFDILEYADPESKEYNDIITVLNETVNLIDFRQARSVEFDSSVRVADEYLTEHIYKFGSASGSPRVAAVGHTHIDIAWLWTVAQTREKAQRSFATVLALMDKYPYYTFFSSQPILYKMIKQDAPELYARIKARVAERRWEPEGSMWVEADCNLISGESMVRQIMYGKRFFRSEFGVENRILWLPDVFGYSAALPQILKKSGVEYFVTSKISWNDTNRMPYDVFRWRGIDGSEVKTYFITTQNKKRFTPSERYTSYIGAPAPVQAAGAYARLQEKYLSDSVMLLYGHGDGGGGPTQENAEYLKRTDKNLPLCPVIKPSFAADFLDELWSGDTADRAPCWSGELYLEYHRGTYTSIAKNKRNNRKAEYMLWNVELLGTLAKELLGRFYPKSQINGRLETMLTNQFHDIIPGSSVKGVYDVTDVEYEELLSDGNKFCKGVLRELADSVDAEGLLVYNPHGFVASGEVYTDETWYRVEDIPPKGYKVVSPAALSPVKVGDKKIENRFFTLIFDDNYEIISLLDKRAGREVLSGPGNALMAYEDQPFVYDAWEISEYYKEKGWKVTNVTSIEAVRRGVGAGYRITRKYLANTIIQTVICYSDTPRIDFETEIDWYSEHNLLKVDFPVNVNAVKATFDIQFGCVERPTTYNTSWEQAKFEVCAHKFADIAEYGYGVSLLNDCKYGYDVHDGVLSLTLIKCATYPNPEADKGKHKFTYSLMPHTGDYREAGVIEEAYKLNQPLLAVRASGSGTLPASFSLVSTDCEGIITETVKEAEDSSDTVIRCYESRNALCKACFTFNGFSKAALCDLLENEEQVYELDNGRLSLEFKPYEIKTIKLSR